MSGRRLLDAVAIYKASRGVASKYVALRKHQWENYNKTSSLARAVKDQTDRITLTVKAASALSERFNSASPLYSTEVPQKRNLDPKNSIPSRASAPGADRAEAKQGLERDYFYQRSERNSTTGQPPESEQCIEQEQAKRYPLPDDSVPPVVVDRNITQEQDAFSDVPRTEPPKSPLSEDKVDQDEALKPASSGRSSIPDPAMEAEPLPADRARKLQRQAEKQIPSRSAESPAAAPSNSGNDVQGQDFFNTRPSETSQSLSGLPRVKLPKVTEDRQEGNKAVSDGQISQEVYYSSIEKDENQVIFEAQVTPEQEQLSEDIYSGIFQSPRVARMLGGKSKYGQTGKGLDLHAQQARATEQTKSPLEEDHESFSERPISQTIASSRLHAEISGEPHIPNKAEDEGIHQLAADMAGASDRGSSEAETAPAELESIPTKAPYEMHESRVPSSRFSRLWQYGGLATSMAFGAVGESFRRVTGTGDSAGGSLMLSAGNMERLVAKLSRMRGAALKLGQMMSFQDSKMLPPAINEVLQRVQDSADYMPPFQRNKVLASNLGSDWRDLFSSFDERPMAAASIGQVHSAVLKSIGTRVAVKVQYPGVANSIDSDLNNLAVLLTASRLLPKGLYLDKTIANARTELAWECDYAREAECGKRFQRLLADEPDVFVIPSIHDGASGPQVLTMDFMSGVGVTKGSHEFSQDQKDWIGTQILRLCLREITEFRFMQTDPNWTNFLFNSATQKLELLDFGASRDFPAAFITPYTQILLAASRRDTAACKDLSIQLGYLTGHESQAMLNAHIASMLTLAEPFMESTPDVYDFRDQTITERVRGYIPVMVRERLRPPPEETYSLHRKLSGAFLLCARLGSRVRCREMFGRAMEKAGLV